MAKQLGTLLQEPEGIYYIPATNGTVAKGILFHEYYRERTDLANKNVIVRRSKIRRMAINEELTAAGNLKFH